MSQPDDELRRRLADLAESAGPWADPPAPAGVLRRAHAAPRHRRALPGRQAQVVIGSRGRHNPRCRDRPRDAHVSTTCAPGWASLQQSRPRGNRTTVARRYRRVAR